MNDLIAETRPSKVTQAEVITYPLGALINPALVYLRGMTPKARRVQANALNAIARLVNPALDLYSLKWDLIEYQHAQAIRADLIELYSPASVNRMLSALRGVAKQAWLLGLVEADQYFRINEIGNVRDPPYPLGGTSRRGVKRHNAGLH